MAMFTWIIMMCVFTIGTIALAISEAVSLKKEKEEWEKEKKELFKD